MIVSLRTFTGAADIYETTLRASTVETLWHANALAVDRTQGHRSGHDEDNAKRS